MIRHEQNVIYDKTIFHVLFLLSIWSFTIIYLLSIIMKCLVHIKEQASPAIGIQIKFLSRIRINKGNLNEQKSRELTFSVRTVPGVWRWIVCQDIVFGTGKFRLPHRGMAKCRQRNLHTSKEETDHIIACIWGSHEQDVISNPRYVRHHLVDKRQVYNAYSHITTLCCYESSSIICILPASVSCSYV